MSTDGIHETAIVESGATIGAGTLVWHHVHVRAGASVGTDCTLGKNVYVDTDVHIGDGVKLQNNVSVFAGVTIEDNVFVGPSAVFTNDPRPRANGEDWEIVKTHVHRGASIGANATIVCGTDIGENAMVGAGAVVTRDVEAHALVAGNPARRIGWVCACGKKLGNSAERPEHLQCDDCRAANP